MTGIRVTGIPEEVTEKHLKVYFSNPNNGGGAVRQIYYPLQDNCAVILFESPSVMSRILKTRHNLDGVDLGVTALPRQIYEKGTMELEKGVSVILSFHRAVIDELQYIGNLKVDFDYNQECYMLKGTWYQLEWALHLLDRTMDSIEGITKYPSKTNEADVNKSDASSEDRGRSKSPEGTTVRSASPEIRSTSPILLSHVPISAEAHTFNPVTGAAGYSPGASGYIPETHNNFEEEEDHFPWNQNYGRDRQGRGAGKTEKRKIVKDDFSSLTNRGGNDKGLKSRGVSSKKEIAFSDIKPRPKRPVGPSLTSGLDVSMIGFGDNQLSYSFELNDVLQVMVVKADITKQRTDGIVSPNTPDLSHAYGVASAIARAADRRFLTECQRYVREHGSLGIADVIHTDAGGNLSPHVGFILHTVGPHWREDNSEAVMHYLVCTYINCFQYSETTLWLKSLSTPLISAGAYGFPLDSCIQAFFDALLIHVTYVERPHLQEIQLVCFDSDSTGAAIMILQSLLEVDRTQSETAALERYRNGCTKYHFNAKLLNTKQRTSKAKEDNAKEEKKMVTVVPVSSDDDSDREETNAKDEKKPLIRSSTTIVDQDDKTPKETQYEGNKRFGYGTKERHEEFKGTDVKGVEESIKTENVIKVVDENKDFNDGAIDNKDRDTKEQQIMRRPEKDREICEAVNPSETHAKDVDNSVVSCVNRSLSDDEKEETNITELTDTDLKHAMNGDHGEMESDSKKELDMNSSKDEKDDETPGVDSSAALRGELNR